MLEDTPFLRKFIELYFPSFQKTSQSVLGSAMHLILPTSLFSFAAMRKTSQPGERNLTITIIS